MRVTAIAPITSAATTKKELATFSMLPVLFSPLIRTFSRKLLIALSGNALFFNPVFLKFVCQILLHPAILLIKHKITAQLFIAALHRPVKIFLLFLQMIDQLHRHGIQLLRQLHAFGRILADHTAALNVPVRKIFFLLLLQLLF